MQKINRLSTHKQVEIKKENFLNRDLKKARILNNALYSYMGRETDYNTITIHSSETFASCSKYSFVNT